MTLRLRRGLDINRQSIVFAEGELVYTTDTKEIYVGDGSTVGGVRVTGATSGSPASLTQNLNLNGYNISGTGTISATSFTGDGSGLTGVSGSFIDGLEYDINVRGNIIGSDSSVIVDYNNNTFNGNFVGDGSQLTNIPTPDINYGSYIINLLSGDGSTIIVDTSTSVFNGIFVGDGSQLTNLPGLSFIEGQEYSIDVRGNVLGFSSTLLIDAFTETITAEALTGHANIDVSGSIYGYDSTLIIDGAENSIYTNLFNTDNLEIRKPTFSVDPFEVKVIGNGDTTAIRIVTQSDGELSGTFYSGKLWFGYEDSTGSDVTSGILGGENAMYFVSNSSSDFSIEANYLTWEEPGKLGIGTFTPAQELDVRGNAIVTGFVQFGSLTTTERDDLTPAAGMVIWNETTTQFEGFNGTDWINLVDGVISA